MHLSHNRFTNFIALLAVFLAAVVGSAQVAQPGPKAPGTIRIGLMPPHASMGAGAQNSSEALRQLLSQYLAGPAVEIVNLDSMVGPSAAVEAKRKDCDFVLSASLSQQKKSGGMSLLKAVPAFTNMVPAFGASAKTGVLAAKGVVQTTIDATKLLSGDVKAKAVVTFDYALVATGAAAPVLSNSSNAKANEDGQDVITPLVAQAATAITSHVLSADKPAATKVDKPEKDK